MDGSLVFLCLVVKVKSSAFHEDVEGEALYSLSCCSVTLAYSELLVRRVPAAVPPAEGIHGYPLSEEALIFARQMGSRDKAVGIVTSYRLDGPVFDFRRWNEISLVPEAA
jgi:hypothetical protein